ncbi:MAG TPA: tetratricopeptide repeat protein [Flavobacteriales bacterium]|nr:tetratricopeptide repeat protein [Flavobacteriales bacterium]
MNKAAFMLITVTLTLAGSLQVHGQESRQGQAKAKGKEAVRLVDQGEFDKGIALLKQASKLDPGNIEYPYELGYAYYTKQEYDQAVKVLKPLVKEKDAFDLIYQLLGNSYDHLGKRGLALDTYKAGLKQFPHSGNLYLEMGVMQLAVEDFDAALSYFEQGIEAAPRHPSNYYWAAKLFCHSSEEVWGMIYGELFMNMERNSRRTTEMSKLLFDTYASEIQIQGDSSIRISFSKGGAMTTGSTQLPYGIGVYEPVLSLATVGETAIDINSLDRIRSRFLDLYHQQGFDKSHPNALFAYQQQVKEAGHLEAYNHWILMKGDEDRFGEWAGSHKEEWDSFVAWFRENGLEPDEGHRFYRSQY